MTDLYRSPPRSVRPNMDMSEVMHENNPQSSPRSSQFQDGPPPSSDSTTRQERRYDRQRNPRSHPLPPLSEQVPPNTSRLGPNIPFDILSWYPKHQSCQKYLIDHAQHDPLVQAFASFMNILLPYQLPQPQSLYTSRGARTAQQRVEEMAGARNPLSHLSTATQSYLNANDGNVTGREAYERSKVPDYAVSLTPYLRRLVATGMDHPGIMHGFFGNDWVLGVGAQHETERRNYLLAAKSWNWGDAKNVYDKGAGEGNNETIPFLSTIRGVLEKEVYAAEKSWNDWYMMQRWEDERRLAEEQADGRAAPNGGNVDGLHQQDGGQDEVVDQQDAYMDGQQVNGVS